MSETPKPTITVHPDPGPLTVAERLRLRNQFADLAEQRLANRAHRRTSPATTLPYPEAEG